MPTRTTGIIALSGATLVLLLALLTLSFSKTITSNRTNSPSKTTNENYRENFLLYGTWKGVESEIHLTDLETGEDTILATLPKSIKKITPLSAETLLFINHTNSFDHGTELSVYSLAKKKITPLVKASEGFGIDEYVLSPNKKYLSYWEVQLGVNGTLQSGSSRVYTVKISDPSRLQLLYDEIISGPIHYPIAITDTGKVFLDTFLPNNGAGWAYGMNTSDFTGSNKQNIDSMQNGTYSSQPILSPDGKFLAFTGYDGAQGPGNEIVNGFRRAIISPNTIEILDISTLERKKLSTKHIPNATYSQISWDFSGGAIIFSRVAQNIAQNGLFSFSLSKNAEEQLADTGNKRIIRYISSTEALLGTPIISESLLANLGYDYSHPYSSFSVLNLNSRLERVISRSDLIAQFIAILPNGYLTKNQLEQNIGNSKRKLQLASFTIKPQLASTRSSQQSSPPQPEGAKTKPTIKCDDYVVQQCEATVGEDKTYKSCYEREGNTFSCLAEASLPGTKPCVKSLLNIQSKGVCYDSPLYIYGPENTTLQVVIHTPIFSPNVSYEEGFDIVISQNDTMNVKGKIISGIEFSYLPAALVQKPSRGTIVMKENIPETLSWYAQNLGLNTKEMNDLIVYGRENITSPYVFISFYNEMFSKRILPITFSPPPDTYINIVFYFKQLTHKPLIHPPLPTFPPIKDRGNITAVEISAQIEK